MKYRLSLLVILIFGLFYVSYKLRYYDLAKYDKTIDSKYGYVDSFYFLFQMINPSIGYHILTNSDSRIISSNTTPYIVLLILTDIKTSHANLLYIDPLNNIIERFEPNGSNFTRYDKYAAEIISKNFHHFTIIKNNHTCDVQCKQTYLNTGGYCLTWSLYYSHIKLLDPTKSFSQISTNLLGKTPDELLNLVLRYQTYIKSMIDLLHCILFLGFMLLISSILNYHCKDKLYKQDKHTKTKELSPSRVIKSKEFSKYDRQRTGVDIKKISSNITGFKDSYEI